MALVDLVPGGDSGVKGQLLVAQHDFGVTIDGVVGGLEPGLHGFHIHMTGDLGGNCTKSGGHFNPDMVRAE